MGTTAKKTRAKATNGEVGAHLTEDIPHEVVQTTGLPDVENPEKQIKLELAKFNLPEAAIAKMKAEYGGLVIADANDKDGYKKVKEAWQDTRTKRTGLEKKGLELRNRYKVITTAIGKEEDRLIELLEPLEAELYGKWKAIDDEKERAKKEREAEEQRQLMVRVEEVMGLGMTLKDGFYCIGDTISMDVATLRSLPDEQYEKLKTAINAKAAELKKIADDEAERKRQEAEQLKQQQEQLQKEQDALKKQQDELRQEQEQMAKERRDFRVSKMQGIGMELRNESPTIQVLIYDSIRLYLAPLLDMSAAEFNTVLETTTEQVKQKKNEEAERQATKKREAEALENKKKFIGLEMERTGMRFIYTAQEWTWEDSAHAFRVSFAELLPLAEADITAKANEWVETIKMAKAETEKNDRENEALQKKAQELTMTDKQKWASMIGGITVARDVIDPTMFSTKAFKQKANWFIEDLNELLKKHK